MAVITKVAASLSTPTPPDNCRVGSGLLCGEDLKTADACYIKQSDNKVYLAGGSGVTVITQEGANVHGFCADDCYFAQKGAATLYNDVDWNYGTALTPGKTLYLDVSAATKGRVGDVSGIAGTIKPCGHIVTDTRVRLFRAIN